MSSDIAVNVFFLLDPSSRRCEPRSHITTLDVPAAVNNPGAA